MEQLERFVTVVFVFKKRRSQMNPFYPVHLYSHTKRLREGTFFIEVGGPGYFRIFFCEKSRGPPTSWNGLMHDPSEIPKQKHLTLPPTYPRQK